MKYLLVLLVVGVLIAVLRARGRSTPDRGPDAARSPSGTRTANRVRLTNEQISALTSASSGGSIYGENRSMRGAQMPNGAACFDLRTIESLVKRGYLASDEKGGYRITDEGLQGLRSGMGF